MRRRLLDVDEGRRFTLAAVNAAYERLTGLRAADVVGRSPIEPCRPTCEPRRAAARVLVVTTGEIAAYVEELHSSPSGARAWSTRLVLVCDDAWRVQRLLGFGRDVTESRRAEAHAGRGRAPVPRAARDLFTEVSSCGLDRQGSTTFVNPRMAEMLGYAVSEMIGRHLPGVLRGQPGGSSPGRSPGAAKPAEGERTTSSSFGERKDAACARAGVDRRRGDDDNGRYVGAVAGGTTSPIGCAPREER